MKSEEHSDEKILIADFIKNFYELPKIEQLYALERIYRRQLIRKWSFEEHEL